MIEVLEVKAACNGVLRSLYPDMKIYGPDTTGALERPSFYTEVSSYVVDYETKNLVRQRLSYKISVMEEFTDEAFELLLFAKVRKAFGLKLKIGNRRITVGTPVMDYTGSKNDVFQITITMDWYDTITESETFPLMADVDIRESINKN